ncbi:MAG: zinc metallopeptidase [Clostridiales bacterium]|nr:zinc metallopeptidase [Clostridiales bacterium]
MFFFDPTYLLMLPGLLLGLWAQAKVQSAFHRYSAIPTRRGVSASLAVAQLLSRYGAGDVAIQRTRGHLTDHYDPKANVLRLSEGVYDSASIAALGIAAHEAGHALQQRDHYPLLALRSRIVPLVNIGSYLSWPIFLGGIIFSWTPLMLAGIILFSLVVLFTLITLPVEFNASCRAREMLLAEGYLNQEEEKGVARVLNAAAMTYVASFVGAALQLLRLLILARNRD